jgi:excisionase family DNA binding protein
MASTDLPNILINQQEISEILRVIIRDELRRSLPELIRESTSKEFLTIDETVQMTGFSKRHLQYLRDQKTLPYHKHGKKILYRRSDVLQFLKDNHVKARGA